MWILATNEIGKLKGLPKEAMEQKIFIGPKNNPVDIIKRNEIYGYMDSEFYRMHNIWHKFHLGFGLPLDKTWAKHPSFIIDIIETFELESKRIERYNNETN